VKCYAGTCGKSSAASLRGMRAKVRMMENHHLDARVFEQSPKSKDGEKQIPSK